MVLFSIMNVEKGREGKSSIIVYYLFISWWFILLNNDFIWIFIPFLNQLMS